MSSVISSLILVILWKGFLHLGTCKHKTGTGLGLGFFWLVDLLDLLCLCLFHGLVVSLH